MSSVTVVTSAGAAAATAAGSAGAQIIVAGFQIGSNVIAIDNVSGAAYTAVSGLVYPTQAGVDPNTLIAATASTMTYQVSNNDTMLFKITLDPTIGDFNVGNVGLLIAAPGGGYTLFSITSFSSADLKYKNNPPIIGNNRIINIAIKLTSLASVVNLSYINVDNFVLPSVINTAALPNVVSALSPLYIVKTDSHYNTTSVAVKNYNSSAWNLLPVDTGWSNAGDISVYSADTGTVNTVIATVIPTFVALTAGRIFRIKIIATNTGATTLNINGLGTLAVVNPEGTALVAGQLVANGIYQVVYDGIKFQLLSISVPAVNKRGDTISGVLRVNGALDSDTSLGVNGLSGTARPIYINTNSVQRWALFGSMESETSVDLVGSNFGIGWYNNAGNYIDTAFYINRLSGITGFRYIPTSPTAPDNDSSFSLATTAFIQKLIQSGTNLYTQDTGIVNALVAVLIPAPAAYYGGQTVRIKIAYTNTGAVTLNLNGLGIKAVVNPDGSALNAAQFSTGAIIQVIYDGTRFQLITTEYATVNRAGDTMTGALSVPLTITVTGANPALIVNAAASNSRIFAMQTSGVARWSVYTNSDAEIGSNAGSNFVISRFADNGTNIDSPIVINRATGIITFLLSPTSITQAINDGSTRLATTAYVDRQVGPPIFYGTTYGVDSSLIANTVTVTLNPVIAPPTTGYMFRVKIANTNTGLTTLNLATTGSILTAELKNPDGTSLLSSQIVAGSIIDLIYDGSRFELLSVVHATVNRTGDVMTGALAINGNSNIYGAAGTSRVINFSTNLGSNSTRWVMGADVLAENGSNTGSNFQIGRYDDSGAYIDSPISMSRASGVMNFKISPTVPTATRNDSSQKAASTQFVSYSSTPIGAIMDFAGPNPPTGWIICNGNTLSRSVYAALFAVIGGYWGTGDGSTTFSIPDLRGRTTFSTDNGAGRLTNGSFGGVGGSQYLQSHNHSAYDSGHNHGTYDVGHNHLAPFAENEPPFGGSGQGIGASANDTDQVVGFTSTAVTNLVITTGYAAITVGLNGDGNAGNIPPMAIVNKIIFAGV